MLQLQGKKLIVYELNEVPERVLDRHVQRHPDSALARVLEHGTYVPTHAADSGVLSPWITWPTVHRGVNNERHCISDFGQDLTEVDLEYPPIWRLLAARGIRTGVFGSLHSYPPPADARYDFYLPDTFAAGSEAVPEVLSAFQAFNLAMVDNSARNVGSSIVLKPALGMLRSLGALGIRPSTLLRLGWQIADERLHPLHRVRRRTSQVQLAFDPFMKQLRSCKPDYATFFTNHVASSMHRYWPAAFPEDYRAKKLSDDWIHSFQDEIGFTMREADRQIGALLDFVRAESGFALVILSSMGQAAVDDGEVVRTQLYIGDRNRFLRHFGVEPGRWHEKRAMLPRYVFQIDAAVSSGFRDRIGLLRVNGAPVEVAEHAANVFMVKLGQTNLDDSDLEVRIGDRIVDWKELGLHNQVIEDETGSYAYHIPQGVMLVYDPQDPKRKRESSALPTTEIAPMILRNFGVPVPAYMT